MNSRKNIKKNVHELFNVKNKVALVTGGAGTGYGSQITEALAEAGATVIITSREIKKAKIKAQQLNKNGFNIYSKKLDLENEKEITQVVNEIIKEHNKIDILFNNAAYNDLSPLETISLEKWNKVLQINISGTMMLSRMVAPVMKKTSGSIINISSIYGMVSPDQSIYGNSGINSPLVYGVSKAAIIQMTKYLATYWAPKIRVNCITPGGLFNSQDENFVKNYEYKTPLKRMADVNDLKGAALFLASEASKWVTGHNLVIDGGWTIW